MDIKMPGRNGIEVLKEIKRIDPKSLVILMTAYGTTETAIEAMKYGAFDYIVKPFLDSTDEGAGGKGHLLKKVDEAGGHLCLRGGRRRRGGADHRILSQNAGDL